MKYNKNKKFPKKIWNLKKKKNLFENFPKNFNLKIIGLGCVRKSILGLVV